MTYQGPIDEIEFVPPRRTVEIHLPDGRVLSGPRGSSLEKFLHAMPEWGDPQVVGAVVNSELRELTFTIDMDARVQPLTMEDVDGARIYRRSLTFLLEAAFEDFFPDLLLAVDHSLASGGFFCEVNNRTPLSPGELEGLEAHMRELVDADLPFERQMVPLEEAIAFFEQKGNDDKVRLLRYRQKGYLMMYTLAHHRDYHHGYMVPSTGYLQWFDLLPMGDGFILRFPRRHMKTRLQPIPESPRLLAAFQQYGNWLSRMGIDNVGSLNDAISQGRIREVILMSEALQEQKIADIAQQIVSNLDKARIILIAGPSSSGKTTFSKRLAVQMLALGVEPFALELDNYFVDRELTPKDEKGEYDFETLAAINVPLLSDHVKRLLAGEEVQLARFDFKQGKSLPGDVVKIHPEQPVIMEGIHGLNPDLLPDIPTAQTFRIFASCLTQLNLDRHNRISVTDSRLIRRIVRDARERGYSAKQTIQRWESVRRGERLHIYPYQHNADDMFNSALVYELSALRPLAEPLLRQVPFGSSEYIEAKRLLAFLEWFQPLDVDLIPDNSILREFIGGSILKEFKLWKREM